MIKYVTLGKSGLPDSDTVVATIPMGSTVRAADAMIVGDYTFSYNPVTVDEDIAVTMTDVNKMPQNMVHLIIDTNR